MTDWKILDLGNNPLSFETARNVLLDPENAHKIFREVPYLNPTGGQAYLFQSPLPLIKLHAKFDPFKFMYLGKGYNKEFAVMKRYYHLKHNRTDLNKQLYNFQRHIYCLAIDECPGNTMNLYLVHYFGNDYLLEDAEYRKGAPTVAEHSMMPDISYDEPANDSQTSLHSDDEEGNYASNFQEEKAEVDKLLPPPDFGTMTVSGAKKRKMISTQQYKYIRPTPPQPEKSLGMYKYAAENLPPPEKKPTIKVETPKPPVTELDNVDYLFAINMTAQLQQLPKEMKARVKFQIATVFYEAEMKALNCSTSD